jgi:hypothetical protein
MNVIKQETGNPENTDTGLPRQMEGEGVNSSFPPWGK